jgi:hypothetical protein
MFFARTQTVCSPSGTGAKNANPWFGPAFGYWAATSSRGRSAAAPATRLPSTRTLTRTAAVLSFGSKTQPTARTPPGLPGILSTAPIGVPSANEAARVAGAAGRTTATAPSAATAVTTAGRTVRMRQMLRRSARAVPIVRLPVGAAAGWPRLVRALC